MYTDDLDKELRIRLKKLFKHFAPNRCEEDLNHAVDESIAEINITIDLLREEAKKCKKVK